VTERNAIAVGAAVGALVGGAAAYLFFTERGRYLRERMEPAMDDLMGEFHRFRRTLEKVGDMANDGLRAFNEFQQARAQTQFPSGPGTSH
jgi:gas vesicle protein